MTKINAPFTEDQVNSIKGYQKSRYNHPFTCGTDGCRHVTLSIQNDGFHCPQCNKWHQTWCHDFMADWTWKITDELMDLVSGRKKDEDHSETV